jgi:hypothetical protein
MKFRKKLQVKAKQSSENDRHFFGNDVKPSFFEAVAHHAKVTQVTMGGVLQTKPLPAKKEGKVVRVEHVDRFRRVPPGRGAYTEAEYKDWQRKHENAIIESWPLFNGKRNPQYPFEALWEKGFYYARLSTDPDQEGTVIEVWLNDKGDGQELWFYLHVPE